MWKKSEEPTPAPAPRPEPAANRSKTQREQATIGPSITIKGDLTGEEDLIIQGRLEGEVTLKKNNVTVGPSGQVKADIYGKSIRIEGKVTGNLFGEQDVIVRASGRVKGNIVSPRVTLENGANFKGSIDMEPASPVRAEPAAPTKESAPGQPPSAAPKPGRPDPGLKQPAAR